jgi:release factor glutamine methyltransferase
VADGRTLLAEIAHTVGDEDDACWLVAHVLGTSPARLAVDGGQAVSEGDRDAARALAARRAAGEPLQHVLGRWGFRTLEVDVDARALVPRPETEQVVEVALEELRRRPGPAGRPLFAAELGTGSGVIALSLAAEGPPGLEVWATDVSAPALELAGTNLAHLRRRHPARAAGVHLAPGSWFEALPGELAGGLDLVVSNPPYVSEREWQDLDPVVRDHDPYAALVAGPSGLEALAHIVEGAPAWLGAGGLLVLELAPHQAAAAADHARRRGLVGVEVRPDLSGRPRVLLARTGPASGAG